MDGPIIHEPRTWKYALPGVIIVFLIPITGKMIISPNPEIQYWSVIPIGFIVLLLAMSIVNLWKYMSTHAAEMFERRQSALSITPLVLLSQNMKQMHPEAVRVLNRFGVRSSWQVSLGKNYGERDWVLADTNAHFGFIEFVLSRSGKALYPKNRFSQGSKKWDPDGMVEDREQYDDLERWLFSRLMVTRSHGEYQPAEFIPPWTPKLILETLGLTGEQDLFVPEGNLKDLGKETNGTGNGNVKTTEAKPAKAEPTYHPVAMETQQNTDLNDKEWQAIQDAMAENRKDYQPDTNLKGVA